MNLREFGDWALAQGQVANPPPNYKYMGECVSLIQQYLYRVFDMPFQARGNAKDWAYNIPAGFSKLSVNTKLQQGDILVYGSNYGGGYGHIGLIDINWKFFDQNGVKYRRIGYQFNPFPGYICILRSNNGVDLGNTFWVRVEKQIGANVRNQPNQNAGLVGSKFLNKGDTFKAVGTVIGESVNGNNVWYKSEKGNYVWSGGLTRL